MSIEDLLAQLPGSGTLVTSTRRLSGDLLRRYHAQKLKGGLTIWETPDIVPWSDWIERCWQGSQSLDDVRLLLSPLQAQTVWRYVIGESAEAKALLQIEATAQLAAEAWDLLHQWRLPWSAIEAFAGEDARAFARWAQHYAEISRAQGWLDRARLPEALAEQLQAGRIGAPPSLILAGFLELTPQQQFLLKTLEAHGAEIQVFEHTGPPGHAVRSGFEDARAEIDAAARWARRLLEDGVGSIGVVVPELQGLRAAIEDRFEDVLAPGAVLPGSLKARPYNISLGRSLAAYPLVHTALQIVQLATPTLPLHDLGLLLRSPYLAGAETELTERALLDARLREWGGLNASLAIVQRLAAKPHTSTSACSKLDEAFKRYRERVQDLPRRQPPSGWAALFAELLALVGWPGERPLTSEEFQAQGAWHDVLQTLATLDLVLPACSYREALAQVHRLAAERIFQPQTPAVPVQILGVLEAAGLRFDQLWVMGLHDEVWPAPLEPNPFLPIALQRRYGLPHASAERELDYATRLIRQLLASASQVVLSYPCHEGDRELRPSPLIAPVEEVSASTLLPASTPDYRSAIYASRQLESLSDHQAPPVPSGERIPGGTALFRDQAACPFRTFARHRLGASGLAAPASGLNTAVRGTLVHSALKLVWTELSDHARLCAASTPELAAIVDRAAANAIEALLPELSETFSERFRSLEIARLRNLIHEWLALERERPDFEVVECESMRLITVGGLSIKTAVDRIDRLADGRKLVIDYKTGDPSTIKAGAWFGERPDEPQLPLYATHAQGDVAAVVFARVRRGQCGWEGRAQDSDIIPPIKSFKESPEACEHSDWQALLEEWRSILENLALAFRSGDARVDPKHHPSTCSYCDIGPLCRIQELSLKQTEEEEKD